MYIYLQYNINRAPLSQIPIPQLCIVTFKAKGGITSTIRAPVFGRNQNSAPPSITEKPMEVYYLDEWSVKFLHCMLLASYIQQYFNTFKTITILTNQVWKLLITLFKTAECWCPFSIAYITCSPFYGTHTMEVQWNLVITRSLGPWKWPVIYQVSHYIRVKNKITLL